jgi:hypothetical protein
MDLWTLLFGGDLGGQRSWLEAAFLVCLFWVALARPERIRSLLEFRIACLLFAAALITPTLTNLYVFRDSLTPGGRINPAGKQSDFASGLYLHVITPLLLLLSFLLAIDSVTPRRRAEVPPPRD